MANYRIYNNGELLNRIVADEAFTDKYCAKHGYTYELEPIPDPDPEPAPDPAYSAEDMIKALIGV